MNNFYVYGYIRLDTNTYFYIGKGHNNRWCRLDNRKAHFINILNITDVAVELLYDNLTEEEVFELEQSTIEDLVFNEGYSIDIPNFKCTKNESNLVNLTWGGDGTCGYSVKQSQETIDKRVLKNKGKKRNLKQRKNISDGLKKSIKENPNFYEHLKKGTRNGAVLSEETKRKISESHKGKVRDKESINKAKETWNNRDDSYKEEVNKKRSETMKEYRHNNSKYEIVLSDLNGNEIFRCVTIREMAHYMFENGLANTYNGARASINECTKNNKIYRNKFKIVKEFTCND